MRDISHLGPDLIRRIDKIDRDIQASVRATVAAAALAAKAEQLEVMRADAGGDLRLSQVRSGKGAAIGARYTLIGAGAQTTANVTAVGPVPLIANPIKEHDIPKRGARVRRARKPLTIKSVGVRASAQHPGTKGKDTWNRGRERAEPKARTVIARRTDAVVKRAFLSGG